MLEHLRQQQTMTKNRKKSTTYLRIIILQVLLILLSEQTEASQQPLNYNTWSALPSARLVDMGANYTDKHMPDSALVCYTIVSSRYSKSLTTKEKALCLKAFKGKWYHYFLSFYDYGKAFESLERAREISEDIHQSEPRVLLFYGTMYQTLSDQSGDHELARKAYTYFQKAVSLAIKQHDLSTLNMAMSNLINVANTLRRLPDLDSLARNYAAYPNVDATLKQFNITLFQGLICMEEGQYHKALALIREQDLRLPDREDLFRYHYSLKYKEADIFMRMNRPDEAVARLSELEHGAERYDMKDAKLEVYRTLSDIYLTMGDEKKSNHYRAKYLEVKDTLLNYQQLASVSQLQFLDDMKQVEKRIANLDQQRQFHTTLNKIGTVVILIILSLLGLLWRKNKQLRHYNGLLYRKTQDILRNDQTERERRQLLEDRLRKYDQQADSRKPQQRYMNSNLTEEEKQDLLNRIMNVVEDSEKILSPDFNVETLASLVESKTKYVSQVINEKFNCNFNSFINEYRVKEACIRFNDKEHYAAFTIEAIANGVGFKSRSSFLAAFKKYTGLTPNDYKRMANS